MTPQAHTRFHWLARPGAQAPPEPWIPLSDAIYWERPSRAPDRRVLFAPAPDWADDLQRVARAVFAADRYANRQDSFDRWTRHIVLSVPVADPAAWQCALPSLTAMLETVTGDRWEVCFRPADGELIRGGPISFPADHFAHEVALFSGGLDSLGWAVQRATVHSPHALLLTMFEERNFGTLQDHVYDAVSSVSQRPLRRLVQSQTTRGPEGARLRLERSTRSRGFLYAATAVHAAAAERVPVVHLPENGQLALNPPLTAARSASCSTRSVHPWTLHHLNRVIAEISRTEAAQNTHFTVRVENPFATLTKGEVCAEARDAGLPQHVLEATLSCGTPPARRAGGPPLAHCGLCFPCIVRRSGLHHAFGEDRTPYAADPWNPSVRPSQLTNWHALRRWLDTECTAQDLAADMPLPQQVRPEHLLEVVTKGREELRALVTWADQRRARQAS
ncbi:7-cyano-7-deazaguanine synthase [Streptomyces sp. NBC_01016]|uniref:7-cyano-7-deazaguanine synthase n=1 Tax=Streptomyces sp. NBC_01016 TaxID=2903720 RepID=UPI002257A4A5|nr:7-cyano-7-deazaguanine synthase [Streptomyces sp. NBC_01016]MCX4834355.1 7-cyano-7-deazaguanine synthase [Streptomyces sp. NBC_01016]